MANRDERHRPIEQRAVKTTIVGGRPPGPGKGVGEIPRGIEVLVKKAAVDPDFRTLLLGRRADAAREIGLSLEPAEAMMLDAVPAAQLETIIAHTTVSSVSRAAFLGKAAAVMLAALTAAGCEEQPPAPTGSRPDPPPTKGILSDRPEPRTATTATPPAKPKTDTPSAKSPAEPEQPMMPVAGVAPQPIPRMKPDSSRPITKGIEPDRP